MLMLRCKESTVPLLVVKGLRAETPITTLKNEDQNFVVEQVQKQEFRIVKKLLIISLRQ